MKKYAFLWILAAGSLWGTMGLFVDMLTSLGFGTLHAAALRICSAALLYFLLLLVKDRSLLKIHLRDFGLFFGLGVLSILALTCFYFLAIRSTSYSVAAILLYTAPVMVSVMSAVFFKERFGGKKIVALLCAFVGCILVSGLDFGNGITPLGIAFGLLSGLAYALYSILGKIALKKYHPYTVSDYAFIFAAFGSLIVCDVPGLVSVAGTVPNKGLIVLAGLLSGFVTAFLPFILYTLGLKNTEPGKAAILASVEPLVATLCGCFKGQPLTLGSAAGIVCILGAVVILTVREKTADARANEPLSASAKHDGSLK